MGQVNCQQCIMPYIEDIKIRQTAKSDPPPLIPNHMHKINILSKNRDSHELFSKKYSTQITREDTEQQQSFIAKCMMNKEKAVVLLQNQLHTSFKIQIEKGKKIIVGTSTNCHFPIPTINHFKISLEYADNFIVINDMGIGSGAFIKSSMMLFQHPQQSTKQLFKTDDNNELIQVTVKRSIKTTSHIQVTMKSITKQRHKQHQNQRKYQHQYQQQFSFNLIDILLKNQNKRKFFINTLNHIDFQLTQTPQNHTLINFHTANCWRYIDKKTLLKQNQIINMGSEQFRVKKILLSPGQLFGNQSDIKIVDFDDDYID